MRGALLYLEDLQRNNPGLILAGASLSSVFNDHRTTLEMLDVLEAGVEALRLKRGNVDSNGASVVSPDELRAGIMASLSANEIANILSVPRETVDDWLNGQASIPSWVPVAIRVISLLTPSARRKLQNGTSHQAKTETTTKKSHPFSRIEEL